MQVAREFQNRDGMAHAAVRFTRRFLVEEKFPRPEDEEDPISIFNSIIQSQEYDEYSNDEEEEAYEAYLSTVNSLSPAGSDQVKLSVFTHQEEVDSSSQDEQFEGNLVIDEDPKSSLQMFKCEKEYCTAVFNSLKGLTIHKLQRHNINKEGMTNGHGADSHSINERSLRIPKHTQATNPKPQQSRINGTQNGEILKCPYCSRNFPNPSALKIHMSSHTRERNFPCPHCEKKFFQSSHLTVHIRTHTGEKPYSCRFCPAKFNSPSNCRVHEKTHLKGNEIFHCEECGIGFLHKSRLERHLRSRKHIHPGGVVPKMMNTY